MKRNSLFLSVDISGSTAYKHSKKYWMQPIMDMIRKVSDHFKSKNFIVWKFLGDEILFYKKYDEGKLSTDIEEILHFRDNFNSSSHTLKIKCTLWSAYFDDHGLLNRMFRINGNMDFLGRHIDFGFRLTKFATTDQLVIDPFIAQDLTGNKKLKVKLLKYESLKGVDDKSPILIVNKQRGRGLVEDVRDFLKRLDSDLKTPPESIFGTKHEKESINPPIKAGLTFIESVTYSAAMFETHGLQINDVIIFLRNLNYPKKRKTGRAMIPLVANDVIFILGIDLRYKTATVEHVIMNTDIFK